MRVSNLNKIYVQKMSSKFTSIIFFNSFYTFVTLFSFCSFICTGHTFLLNKWPMVMRFFSLLPTTGNVITQSSQKTRISTLIGYRRSLCMYPLVREFHVRYSAHIVMAKGFRDQSVCALSKSNAAAVSSTPAPGGFLSSS